MSAARPTIGVLALQGDVREHVRALEGLGAATVRVRRPAELAGLDGIVLPGGESTAMSRLLTAFELLEPLRAALRGGLPAFGTCAGMVLLADRVEGRVAWQETLGGLDVTVRRNAFGRQVDSFESVVHLSHPAGTSGPAEGFDVPATFIRAPWVEEAGEAVEVLARVEDPQHGDRIVAVRQGHLLATSFHPEVTGDPRVHGLFVELVRGA